MRAISHNQAQTVVLGINQLTTGLFRALERFAQKAFAEAERDRMIAERLYRTCPFMKFRHPANLSRLEKRIPQAHRNRNPGRKFSFVALREDSDAMQRDLPLFQQELLRRHG